MIKEILTKRRYDLEADRIGPDIPFTHWKLFFKSKMKGLCEEKFLYFGEGSEFRPYAYAINCSKISIGKNVTIRPTSMLFAGVSHRDGALIEIQDYVLIGSGVHIYTSNHRFSDRSREIYFQGHNSAEKVTIRTGAWIGAGSILLPGVEVGCNSVIGAGSIVTKNIPDFCIAVGNPAKVIKIMD